MRHTISIGSAFALLAALTTPACDSGPARPVIDTIEVIENGQLVFHANYSYSDGRLEWIEYADGSDVDNGVLEPDEAALFFYEGDLLARFEAASSNNGALETVQTTTFFYDSDGRLLSSDTASDGVGSHTDFTYNDGALAESRTSASGGGLTSQVDTTFSHDGEDRLFEIAVRSQYWGDFAPDPALTYTRLNWGEHGPSEVKSEGNTTYIDYDGEGRVASTRQGIVNCGVLYNDDGLIREVRCQTGGVTTSTRIVYAAGESQGPRPSPPFAYGYLFDMAGESLPRIENALDLLGL